MVGWGTHEEKDDHMGVEPSPQTLVPQDSGLDVPSGEEEPVVLDEEGQEEVHHPFCCHGNQVLPNQVPLEWI